MIPRLPIRAAVRWLGRRRAPLLVAWRLTERCNLRCRQCALWLDPPEELSPREAEAYAREMVAEGVLAVSLLGGEVLLREDLGRLIAILDHGGVAVRVTSNGILVPRRLDTLRRARLLKLSLDGPEEVHDSLRGQGAYAGLMAGLEAARRAGIPVQLNTVLSRELLPGIDAYLALVQRLACRVSFQPLELRAGLSPRDLDELSLAYVLSIHKSQGSEFPCVVVPVHTQHYLMLQRNLLYTAVTRAKKLVVLVGSKKALGLAIRQIDTRQRNTALRLRLQSEFARIRNETDSV